MGTLSSELLNKSLEHPKLLELLDNPSLTEEYRLPKRIHLERDEDRIKFIIDIFLLKTVDGKRLESDIDLKVWSWLPLDEFGNEFSHP